MESFKFDWKGRLWNLTELFHHLDLASALPNLCYVFQMKRNNSKIYNLILQNKFQIFKTKLSFQQKKRTFHEVPKTKYGDLNQEPSFLKAKSN